MTEARLTISVDDKSWQVELNPAGTVVGRSPDCDVEIESRDVSRRHARLFQDPTGTWIIEDLNSSNGTFVNGKRVTSSVILLEDIIEIGPAFLSFSMLRKPIKISSTGAWNIIIEDFGTEVFYDKPKLENCDRQPCPERLAEVKQRLSELAEPSLLYAETCHSLAQEPKTAAAVFRVLREASSPPQTPQVLACHFGNSIEDDRAEIGGIRYPSHLAFRVSHRLLEMVCQQNRPLMTKSIFTCDTEVTVSLIDEHSPRALMCVPLNSAGQTVDLLYVDVPIDDRFHPGPEEMFVLLQAVAKYLGKEREHRGDLSE